MSLSNLHENELERQLQNLTPIVSNIILANLLKLSEDDVRLNMFKTHIVEEARERHWATLD